MNSFQHILFPVDLSEKCLAARPIVEAWARHFDAKVSLLHTIQIPITSYGGPDGYPIVIDIPAIEAAAKARLDRFAFPGANREVSIGDPGWEIIQFADKYDVDLIMMPTHGYGKFRGLLLGSTAAKVLHDAECPVWTSPHCEEIPVPERTEIHNILCAIEVSPETTLLVKSAEEFAAAWGAKLHMIHAGETDESLEKDVEVKSGAVSTVIHDAALEHDADLIITGRGHLHETFGRLRTNTYEIIRNSPCPVLSIP